MLGSRILVVWFSRILDALRITDVECVAARGAQR
jgi:hypothetical protein